MDIEEEEDINVPFAIIEDVPISRDAKKFQKTKDAIVFKNK